MSGSGPSSNIFCTDVMSSTELQQVFEKTATDIPRASYELIFLVLRDTLDAQIAAKAVSKLTPDVLQQVVDTIWLVSNEIKHFDTIPVDRMHSFVRALAKELPNSDILLCQLPPDILSGSQVLSDDRIFLKKLLRTNTRNLYVQKKYNLLHEESEGYAKLVTELSRSNIQDHENLAQRITSLIGHFNLDPNRVEDLVLEALELNISESNVYMPLIRKFRKNRLCHLVGHKFHTYQTNEDQEEGGTKEDASSSSSSSSSATNASNASTPSTPSTPSSTVTSTIAHAPETLYRLAAALIASGDLNASHLLPHLSPSNEQLREERETHELYVFARAKGLGKKSLGVSPEEKLLRTRQAEAKLSKHQENRRISSLHNQKFGILSGMFDIGAWNAAKKYNEYLSNTAGANPRSDPLVIRAACSFCCTLLTNVYQQLPQQLNPSHMNLVGVHSFSKSSLNHQSKKETKETTTTRSTSEFSMQIPTTFEDLASSIGPVLRFIGEGIATDLVLFSKVCRLLRHIVSTLPNVYETILEKDAITDIVVNVLLPGLAMVTTGNAGICNELWGLLKLFPFGDRYKAYANLKSELYSKRTPLVLKRAQILEAASKKLRRLAVETVKQQGRHLGKLALSNPVVVFATILDQVEVYDNMIPTVVDSMKYMSELSYDVLSFILIDKLASSRDKLKGDGINISGWLQSLAIFAGTFYRRYPTTELGGLLQYLTNCLEAKRSLDLIVFRELISRMAGIQIIDGISHDQLQGRSGGLVLRAQTNVLGRHSGSMRKAASALHNAVITSAGDDTPLCVVLLVLLAQQRDNIILETGSQQLKLIGRLYDECHMTLIQFVDFLSIKFASASKTTAEAASAAYCAILPSITVLLSSYKMKPGVAFHVTRPSFSTYLRNGGLIQNKSSDDNDTSTATNIQGTSPINKDVLAAVQDSLDQEVWTSITPTFFSVFWSLSLYDIHTPTRKYETVQSTLQSTIKRNETELRKLDQNSKPARELRREQRSKQNAIDDLKTEFKVQKDNERVIRRWLQQQKTSFLEGCGSIDLTPQSFLQHCILPRALCSPEDAYFCANFTAILNEIQTPGWSSLNYYDKLHRCLASVVYCVTEREAANLSIFLQETLRLLERWTNSKIYTNECASKPGFSISIRQNSGQRATFDQYVKIFGKWHSKVSLLKYFFFVFVFCCLVFLLHKITQHQQAYSLFPFFFFVFLFFLFFLHFFFSY